MKYFLIFCLLHLAIGQLVAINCECGTHATGITTYHTSGSGCCTTPAVGVGLINHYQLNDGVWEFTGSTQISGLQAQARCCPPT